MFPVRSGIPDLSFRIQVFPYIHIRVNGTVTAKAENDDVKSEFHEHLRLSPAEMNDLMGFRSIHNSMPNPMVELEETETLENNDSHVLNIGELDQVDALIRGVQTLRDQPGDCLLYTSDAADE